MLIIYNPIGTSFVCGFQLSNKKEFILYLFEIPLVDPLTLTIVLSLFNPYINITTQKFSSTPFHLLFIILYSSPPCGSTPVLPSYLLLRHSCTWDKASIFWSCQATPSFFLLIKDKSSLFFPLITTNILVQEDDCHDAAHVWQAIWISPWCHIHVTNPMNLFFYSFVISSFTQLS
jgi:hypothetical protein